jgi:hypothetical protein
MTWNDDKKQILSKVVDLYQEIEAAPNRYDASKQLFQEFDFFFDTLTGFDPVMKSLVNIDKEYINAYLDTMSELMGEET